MQIIAVHNLSGPVEETAVKLAEALGATPYETRPRAMAPNGGPSVVARFAAVEPAAGCAARLQAAGFHVLRVDTDDPRLSPSFADVTALDFGEQVLRATVASGAALEIAYEQVTLMIRATGIQTEMKSEVDQQRKFSLGRAVMTGGLVMSKTQKTVTENLAEERENFLALVATGHPVLRLRQERLDFSGLGEHRQPSRDANFNWICGELARRCPQAAKDDRLRNRAGQVQLLGPALPPEQFLDLAIGLLAQSYAVETTGQQDRI